MDEIKIKKAFEMVKNDINSLKNELNEIKNQLFEVVEYLENSTHNAKTSTHSTHSSTHNYGFEGLKHQNLPISTGNGGASTDRQTDRQTDTYEKSIIKKSENSMENAIKVLNSLDSMKKEIRLKFKRLTDQEFLVFSTIYQLNEELDYVDYKILAEKLNLTESSIRDYVGRIIKKGVLVEKNKVNNKNIHLSISESLKKMVSLSTILQLRDL